MIVSPGVEYAAGLVELSRGAPGAFWVVAVLAVVVEARPFVVPGLVRAARLPPSVCFGYALLLGWGLPAAVVIQVLAAVAGGLRQRHWPGRIALDAGRFTVSLVAAALVITLTGTPNLLSAPQIGPVAVVGIVAAALAWFVVDEIVLTAVELMSSPARGWAAGTRTGWLAQDALSAGSLLALSPLIVAAARLNAALIVLLLVPLYAGAEAAGRAVAEQQRAQRDALTGLPNRKALFAEMDSQARAYRRQRGARTGPSSGKVTTSSRSGRPTARCMVLLVLDIDQFRQVNDALGHVAGDRLLAAVADRLVQYLGRDAMVVRLGGDEFAIFVSRLAEESAVPGLTNRVAAALAEPVRLEGLPVEVAASIGVAVFPRHGEDSQMLLRNAEIAMYDAKNRSAPYAMYAPESDRNTAERLGLLADLRRALEVGNPGELSLNYQPQVLLATGDVVGVEALLRWRHPTRGMISPDFLIKIVEHTSVMHTLTRHILTDVISQLAAWRAEGLHLRASVNVSVRDLHQPELVDVIAELLANRGVGANQLQLEITEGALMADPRRVMVTLHRLESLGVALSLDDFGVGYSSLQHLRRLPLAEVKIDRSFVLGMINDSDDAAVVHSIVDLARALGLRVVAEGVEEEATRMALLHAGCDVGQGWYYARAMPADTLAAWLTTIPAIMNLPR